MNTRHLVAMSALLVFPACDKEETDAPKDELAAPSPVESAAAPTKAAPTKAAPEAKPLQGELTAAWLLANPPAAKLDPSGVPTKWSDVGPILEKQYGKPTHAVKGRFDHKLYWAAMNKRECAYVSADVQDGKYVNGIDSTATSAKYGSMRYETCLEAAGESLDSLAKSAPIAGDGASVSVAKLLENFAAEPDEWNTAKLTVTGVRKGLGRSSTSKGVTTYYFTVADAKDPAKQLGCSSSTEPSDVKEGDKMKVEARFVHRDGNKKPSLAGCVVK